MTPENTQALRDILTRIHDNSVYAFNRARAVEIVVKRNPDLWKLYEDALHSVENLAVHRDFDTLLERIR